MIRRLFFGMTLAGLSPLALATGSSLVATGGITSFEGTAGGGITPWAMIAGYGAKEEIQALPRCNSWILASTSCAHSGPRWGSMTEWSYRYSVRI